jgi:hypothetical protein
MKDCLRVLKGLRTILIFFLARILTVKMGINLASPKNLSFTASDNQTKISYGVPVPPFPHPIPCNKWIRFFVSKIKL